MQVLAVIFPVILMIGLGVFCRGAKLLSREGVSDIKRLVMSIMLPVAIFHALGSADYGVDLVVRIAVMLGAILLSFGMGFLLRPLVKEPYRKYVPFLVSVYEGGMIGYPLYTSLCSTENLPVCSARALRPSSAASWCRACWILPSSSFFGRCSGQICCAILRSSC